MEKETLEEVAEINCESITHPYCDREKSMFIKGAKWQQQNIPIKILDVDNIYAHIENGFVIIEKYDKSKISYTDEEVLELLHKRMTYTLGEEYKEETTLEWFEQFKKK